MKTGIIIPEPISQAAEQLARQLGISLDQFYSEAVTAYVMARQKETVTDALNRLYSSEPSQLDPTISKMQSKTLKSESW